MEIKESKETKSLNIHDRLANIQSEVHAPKDQYNALPKDCRDKEACEECDGDGEIEYEYEPDYDDYNE